MHTYRYNISILSNFANDKNLLITKKGKKINIKTISDSLELVFKVSEMDLDENYYISRETMSDG